MTVHEHTVDRVRVIAIDRPNVRNAVDGPTALALGAAFRAFDADDSVDVAVLCGAGGTFCSGADLSAVHDPVAGRMNRVEEDGDGPMGPTRLQLSKPVIAAIDGYAVAGGLELACWCDLRVVEESAVLGVFCRRVGVPLIDGGTIRLPRLIGLSRALDLILTGRPVTAREAEAIGLANRVVADGAARAEAIALAQALSALPQACLRADRRSTYEQHDRAIDDALRAELRGGKAVLGDAAPTVAAFVGGKGRHGAPL